MESAKSKQWSVKKFLDATNDFMPQLNLTHDNGWSKIYVTNKAQLYVLRVSPHGFVESFLKV